ncbi:SDR family oxidoreductase [Streptomyces iconiensis]|uniref:SDR family oxidoreductase n=1 Tax=Streptomyces iconiensis TaxID=1384038 RepID=A0ABT7A618_9ACTN|nr:SDR family oxidoreductase [Streptomyces iconiensis]MDJ1136788.1 SDR family oxidoreductase [Streptomyces iconiensis]
MSVLITGATGFLGCRILGGLLAQETDAITVLGRGTPAELRERVEAALSGAGLLPTAPDALDRLRFVSADLTSPGLGLSETDRDHVTEDLTAVWHCAAYLNLQGDPVSLYRANVLGTREVLALADKAPAAHLLFISTAYVAGCRRTGHVMEDELTEEYGFQTYYEETKHTAERMIHSWARRTGRTATILRPSLLATDQPIPEGQPHQPLAVFARLVDDLVRVRTAEDEALVNLLSEDGFHGSALHFRVKGDPEGTLNLIQVDHAARAMVRAAASPPRTGVRTVHVTHPHNTTFDSAASAFEALYQGVNVTVTPTLAHPTPFEALAASHGADLLTFTMHRRTYDRTNLLRIAGDLPDPDPIDSAYLARALGCVMEPSPA